MLRRPPRAPFLMLVGLKFDLQVPASLAPIRLSESPAHHPTYRDFRRLFARVTSVILTYQRPCLS